MRVAIVGCGQLARMLALAGWPLGIRFAFIAEPEDSTVCVDGLGDIVVLSPDMPTLTLYRALGEPDVITVEKEAVDTSLLHSLSHFCKVHPNAAALFECQNRRRQKIRLDQLAIPATPARFARDANGLRAAVHALGFPVVIKAAEHGYDGKSQWRIPHAAALNAFLQQQDQGDWVVEQHIGFDREISLLAVRSASGECAFYPATENHHVNGVLRTSLAPALAIPAAWITDMQAAMLRLMDSWHYVGMLAMECFVVSDGLLVNELAPRVHNSGHWTQQAPLTSQFENHLRAIVGWPLGNTQTPLHSAMINLIGVQTEQNQALATNTTLHWYNKTVRAGRKVGHINLQHPDRHHVEHLLHALEQQFYPATTPCIDKAEIHPDTTRPSDTAANR